MNYKVSVKRLVVKTIMALLLLFILIYSAVAVVIYNLEDYSYDNDESNRITACDRYYYEGDCGELRDYLTLYELRGETYDVYWEYVNGYDDYCHFLMWNKDGNIEKIEFYREKVKSNAKNASDRNKKILGSYLEKIESVDINE